MKTHLYLLILSLSLLAGCSQKPLSYTSYVDTKIGSGGHGHVFVGASHEDPGYSTHTTFSLWDTYRAAMPLYSIFQQERHADFINTMVKIFEEQGKLPIWHLHACETDCMVGSPGHLRPHRAICPRKRAEPPHPLPLHHGRTAMEDGRQGSRSAFDHV